MEHNERLEKEAGVTLNEAKCEFSTKSVKYFGHTIDTGKSYKRPAWGF